MDLLTTLLNLAVTSQVQLNDPASICATADCPTSVMSATSAAMGTQGLWVQADIIHHILYGLNDPSLGETGQIAYVPALVWVIGCIGGLLGVALGSPPKQYLWFFMGPALFSFLIGTTSPVKGMRWAVGGHNMPQQEVWRIAEPGMVNLSIVRRMIADTGFNPITSSKVPGASVEVAMPFVFWDNLVSSVVDSFVAWSGIGEPLALDSSFVGTVSNLRSPTMVTGAHAAAGSGGGWYILQNLRWQILDDVLSARLQSSALRLAFTEFTGSECGKELKKQVSGSQSAVLNAASLANLLPAQSLGEVSFFKGSDYSVQGSQFGNFGAYYGNVIRDLSMTRIPTPRDLMRFLEPEAEKVGGVFKEGSFARFAPMYGNSTVLEMMRQEIDCSTYLHILVNGFRWQSGLQFWNLMMRHAPSMAADADSLGTTPEAILPWMLFYGWDLNNARVGPNKDKLSGPIVTKFLQSLIFFSLMRNEMRMAPEIITSTNSTTSAEIETYAQRAIGMISGKQKYGELYSWVQMVPTLQGTLLYFFAMLYPFAVIMMLLPGMHKTLFTWMSFWAWIKSWDIGFALVNGFERSLWSLIGNSAKAVSANSFMLESSFWAPVSPTCYSPSAATLGICSTVDVTPDGASVFGGGVSDMAMPIVGSFALFDRALLLANNLNLDYANGQYMFLLAGLYLSVPAILATLILGSKASLASMGTKLIEGAGQDGGSAAKSGTVGMNTTIGQMNKSANDQMAFMKSARAGGMDGLAGQAIAASNASASDDMQAGAANAEKSGRQNYIEMAQRGTGIIRESVGLGEKMAKASMSAGLDQHFAKGFGTGSAAGSLMLGAAAPDSAGSEALHNWGKTGAEVGAAGWGANRMASALRGMGSLKKPSLAGALKGAISGDAGMREALGYGNSGSGVSGTSQSGTDKWIASQDQDSNWRSLKDGMMEGAVGLPAAIASGSSMIQFQKTAMANDAKQSQLGIDAYGAQTESARHRQSGDRLNQQADYAAKSGAWDQKGDYAMQMGGWTAATGMSPGSYGPGEKPSNMTGMAMAGDLGGDVSSASHYFSNGGAFAGERDAHKQGLQNSFGEAALMNRPDVVSSMNMGIWGAFGQGMSHQAGKGNDPVKDFNAVNERLAGDLLKGFENLK